MAITQKVTQHCKLSARRSCWYPRRAQNQVQISSLRSFQKLRWRELCTAYQISFWAKQYVTALHSSGVTIVIWLSRSVGSRISWFFPARRVRTILPLFKWLNHLNWSQFNRISFWESEFMKSLVEPIIRWCKLPVTDILRKLCLRLLLFHFIIFLRVENINVIARMNGTMFEDFTVWKLS